MEYTLTLQFHEDYNLIKKLLKAFDGASIRPKSRLEQSIEKAREGLVASPFHSTQELMHDLLS